MVPQIDQTYIPGISADPAATPLDKGVPELYYCHNVMPSTYGFQSIGYKTLYAGDSSNKIQDVKLFQATTEGLTTYVSWDYQLAQTIKFLQDDGTWERPNGATDNLSIHNYLSVATVNGVSFVCVSGRGTYTYTKASNTLNPQVLSGLSDGAVLGVLAANGYMIAWSSTGVNWSATNDPLDFVPSDVTGAGGGAVQELKGPIVWCQPTSYGFIIYTTQNAVSVTYSGNSTFPFNFKDLGGSGGIASSALVSQESTGFQYAYTTNGIQKIFHTGATTFLPYVTDFLAGKIFEDFDENTNQFLISHLSTVMRKKVTLISDRYLIVSYGISSDAMLTHALIFDIVAQRMGKVRINHNAAFEIQNLAPEVVETPRDSIGFLNESGMVSTIDFDTMSADSHGVSIYGKYQLIRSRKTQLDEVFIENSGQTSALEVFDLVSYNGKDAVAAVPGYEAERGTNSRKYLFDDVGENHSILLKGSFNIISMELMTHSHGRM